MSLGNLKALETETLPDPMTIPNWRVLDTTKEEGGEFDPMSVLSVNAPWSTPQYDASLELYDRLMKCADSYVAPLIKEALNCLDHAYRLYGPHSVVCSYNGGKDAVVILHLVRAAHAKHYRNRMEAGEDAAHPCRPRVIYFEHENEFPEVLSLLHETVDEYDLNMVAFERGVKFSEGLEILVENNTPPGAGKSFPMSFVLGTRTTDPNAGTQGQFAPSSHYMPPFMRVNPVLDWTYGHVWHFLRLFKLKYCSLYDEGYTSLGTTKDTSPCPALAVAGSDKRGSGVPKYWPAYMLRDWDQERAGRTKKEKDKQKTTKKKSRTPVRKDSRESQLSAFTTITDLGAASAVASAESTASTPAPSITEADWDSSHPSTSSLSSDGTQRSVGLLIIGDEILKGLIADTNTQVAATALREHNVLLARVVVVSDDQDEIITEILRMQTEVDIIITSGGVGPTHDDVTIKSVAAALDREMDLNEEMVQLLQEKMNHSSDVKTELTEAQTKMATLPANSKLRYLSDNKNDWPILQCRNVFILPGVPQFFEKKINSVALYLSSQLERSITYKVVLSVDEASIVQVLNSAVKGHPHVSFGSYPFVSHPEFKTVVTLEGRMVAGSTRRNSTPVLDRKNVPESQLFSKAQMDMHVREALDCLIDDLPEGSILRVDNNDGFVFS